MTRWCGRMSCRDFCSSSFRDSYTDIRAGGVGGWGLRMSHHIHLLARVRSALTSSWQAFRCLHTWRCQVTIRRVYQIVSCRKEICLWQFWWAIQRLKQLVKEVVQRLVGREKWTFSSLDAQMTKPHFMVLQVGGERISDVELKLRNMTSIRAATWLNDLLLNT